MRGVVVALVAGCSFEHGSSVVGDGGVSGDGGVGDATRDGSPGAGSRKLVFDNSESDVDFGPHPVLVVLDATRIDYAAVPDPTRNLRFEYATDGITASVGDNVPYEIEKWNPSGESLVWIRVPEIKKGTRDTAVLMHFGPVVNGKASAADTWASWELVNHMSTGLAGSIGPYTPTAINMSHGPGQIGEAARFSGSGDARITFNHGGALFDGWSEFFVSFWIYADYGSAAELAGQPMVMDKGTSVNLGRLFENAGELVFQLDQHYTGMGGNSVYVRTAVPPRTWTFLAISFDRQTVTMMKDGAPTSTVTLGNGNHMLLPSTQPFYLGHGSNPFKGMIDELRIERRSRPVDFMRAQYRNATRQFVTFTAP